MRARAPRASAEREADQQQRVERTQRGVEIDARRAAVAG